MIAARSGCQLIEMVWNPPQDTGEVRGTVSLLRKREDYCHQLRSSLYSAADNWQPGSQTTQVLRYLSSRCTVLYESCPTTRRWKILSYQGVFTALRYVVVYPPKTGPVKNVRVDTITGGRSQYPRSRPKSFMSSLNDIVVNLLHSTLPSLFI